MNRQPTTNNSQLNRGFWRDKKVLITGHTGFKGSWLTLWLESWGARVAGYSLEPPSVPSLFECARIKDTVESIHGDVRDLNKLISVLKSEEPEIVVHMAAQALVRRSYIDPVETYSTNVMGAVNLLEGISVTSSVRVAIIVTSDKCYENKEWLWPYRECEALGGHDPYSSSKACAELVAAAFRNSFCRGKTGSTEYPLIASVRTGNVIGGGDWAEDRLVPDIMKAFIEGKPALIRNPTAVRPWQHVLDPLNGYMILAEKLFEGHAHLAQAWNFGPDNLDAKPVSWVASKLTELWGDGATWISSDASGPHEAGSLTLDSTKARTFLHWTPLMTLDHGLEWVQEWYKGYSEGQDVRQLTLEQISRFQELSS